MFATTTRIIFSPLLVLALGLFLLPASATSKGLFTPVAYVNDNAITNYELQQRILLLKVLRTPGDLETEAMERLINERLQIAASTRAGISLTQDEIIAGVDEFAERAELTGEQFLAQIAAEGVAADSFRDFVKAGLLWRKLVRAKFVGKAAVTDIDIDRAIHMAGTTGSAQVLISEIFLPTNSPENTAISLELAPQIARLRSVAEFSEAARRFSAGPSKTRGGVVPNWVPITNLPANIRSVLLTMKPGEVTEPIEIPNALALFQLRALQETTAPAGNNPAIDYAAYYIPGGRSEAALERAAEVRELANTCDDLYGVAINQPPETLDRDTLPMSEIPPDVALELAKLDAGEVSTALTRANGETLVFLMLCSRSRDLNAEVSRTVVRQNLVNQLLADLAEGYLDELRANAVIRLP